MKKRIALHANNAVEVKNKGGCLDYFTNYLVQCFKRKDTIEAKDNCKLVNARVRKELNLILESKKFRSYKWKSCAEERFFMIKAKLFKLSKNCK